ncbi:MAG: viperin family antiviral radical SAM protein [Myxococcales bacterium]|nr:viperin family antiviral radical SAM protein [Myxococcales bacterium]
MSQPAALKPIAVNFHLWPKCNLKCTFCYATFPNARNTISTAASMKILDDLQAAGTEKITFVGGEPTLHPGLPELVVHAAKLGMTTCIVTNGAKLPAVLDAAGSAVHWVGLSVDSARESVQAQLGRGHGDHVRRSLALAEDIRRRGIRLKLNSVVTALNWQEDLSRLVRQIRPERWKAFEVLSIEGENADRVQPLRITTAQFQAFVSRHAHLAAEGLGLIAEDNDAMTNSYVMIDPQGRFFSNADGSYTTSEPIAEVGVANALAQVGWQRDKFVARGGLYNWRQGAKPSSRPFIVAIEGLDGTGKSTTVGLLAKRLSARVIRNPPEELAHERAAADKLPAAQRREWYLGANRRAVELARQSKGSYVVLDRSAASTFAFGRAELGEVATEADWPADFPRPDLTVLLDLPEPQRRARHAGRGDGATTEEQRLARDHAFRDRVLAGYRALCDLSVDAEQSPNGVVASVCREIAHRERSRREVGDNEDAGRSPGRRPRIVPRSTYQEAV